MINMSKKIILIIISACFCIVLIFVSCLLKYNKLSNNNSISESAYISENDIAESTNQIISEPLPQYYTDNKDNLYNQKDIDSSYVRNFYNGINHFWIDEENVLWGTGYNNYGQLGNGYDSEMIWHTDPIEIAENVMHFSCDMNGRFLLFLTDDKKLYGIGANCECVLMEPYLDSEEYNPTINIVTEPKLLMENIIYASAGLGNVSVLQENGDVFWWGKISVTTATQYDPVHKNNMFMEREPRLMIDNGRYVVSGLSCVAAIDNDNNLWMWGNNTWGQCATESVEDWIKDPLKVADNIEMVWPEYLSSLKNEIDEDHISNQNGVDINPYSLLCSYPYNTFIRTKDGSFMVCGIDIGENEKTVEEFGDIYLLPGEKLEDVGIDYDGDFFTHNYSIDFLPIQIK